MARIETAWMPLPSELVKPRIAGVTRLTETENGRIAVRYDGVRDHQVMLTISGEQVALAYK